MSENSEPSSLEEKLTGCETVLQYRFSDRELLTRCLTHASVARTRLVSNERLEFLGDSILGLIVCEALFHRFPEFPEGELTRVKSALVSRNTCSSVSQELGLERYLLLGKGLSVHDTVPSSIMAAVFESLIAGVYLDGGLEAAREMVERLLEAEIDRVTEQDQGENFKSQLQQMSQKTAGETPVYRLLDEKGPDHSKCFQVAAMVGSKMYSAAWGTSKKEAEQRAAQNALLEIEGNELPYAND